MKRKILNVRLAIGLLIGIAVFAVAVHLVHGMQVRRTAVSLRDQADKAEKAGRTDQAEDYLSRYLIYRPADVDSLIRYAGMLEKSGSGPEMREKVRGLYKKAIQVAPNRSTIRSHLVELELAGGQYSEAKVQAKALADASPKDGELRVLLGRCEEGTGQFAEAATLYEEAAKLDPTLVEAYTRRATLLRGRLNDPDRADLVMDAKGIKDGVISANPKSAAAFLARASYREMYAVAGGDAASDVAKALELDPEDAAVRLAAARVAVAKNDLDAARGHLEYGVKQHAEVTAFYPALSDLELAAGHIDKAAEWLRKGISSLALDRGNDRVILNWTLADLLIQNGKADEADAVIKDLEKQQVRTELLGYLEASSLAAKRRYAAAAKRLAEVAPALAALPEFKGLAKRSWIALARCYERLGNADQRLDAYRQAVTIDVEPDPLRISARFGLAASLVALDKIDDALDEYRRIPNNAGASLAIVRLQLLQNLSHPEDQKNWGDINRTLDAVEQAISGGQEAERGRSQVTILRAEALTIQGHGADAHALLDKAIAKSPDQVDLRVALANLLGRSEQPEQALATLDEAEKRLGDRAEFRQARVAYWAKKGGDEASAALAKLEQGTDKLDPEGLLALRRDLAAAYDRIGRGADAERLWKQLAETRPDDLNVRLSLFDLAMNAKDRAAAAAAVDQIKQIEGEGGSLWRYAHAVLLMSDYQPKSGDRSPLIEAGAELGRVAVIRPSWSRVPLALAEIDLLDGRADAAIDEYMRAIVGMGDRSPAAIRRVARLLGDRQRYSEADLVLKKLRDTRVPLSSDMQRLAAQVAFRNQDYSGALETAEAIVSQKSDDYRDLIWLGQMRWAAGQPAESILRRAVGLAKDAPEPRIALMAYLVGTGKKAEAEAALKAAEQELPREKSALVLAQGYQLLGEGAKAEAEFMRALAEAEGRFAKASAADPQDLEARTLALVRTLRGAATFQILNKHVDKAIPLLQKIVDLKAMTADALWARRALALSLAGQGDHKRILQALEILGVSDQPAKAGDGGGSPEDLRARARILAGQPSRARRLEAIATLEGLINRGLAVPEDSFVLAQLYDSLGEWAKAKAHLQGLVRQRPDNPTYLAISIRALMRHGELEEARRHLTKLEALAPGQPIVVELNARLLSAAKQGDKAAALLKDYAMKDDSRLEPTARLCEELDQDVEAERLYRLALERTASRRPAVTLVLAGFLGRHGRTAEAMDLIDKQAWASLPAPQVSNVALTVLYGTGSDESALRDRFAERLEAAIRKEPAAITLRFDLANLRWLQGRFDDSEKIFREIADANPSLGSPLNNLAWILAMRGDKTGEALKLIDKAIELDGDQPELLDTRGIVRLVAGQTDLAARDLEDAIAVSPTPDKYLHLARVYLAMGKRSDAERALRDAQARGLTASILHPLEQTTFKQLVAEFPK